MKFIFFIGKGGTGKTFLSSTYSIYLSDKKYKTLIISLDPAHNLGDTLKIKLDNKINKIDDYLFACEVDIDNAISNYLKSQSENLKNIFKYLSVTNIDSYLDILKKYPGMEEYSMLEVIKYYIDKNDFDYVIFDMPPTGITLRVFGLIEISSIWNNNLIKLRNKILESRNIINKIEYNTTIDINSDPIIIELLNYQNDINKLKNFISSNNCEYLIITNPDNLALMETNKIFNYFRNMNIKIKNLIINKIYKFSIIPEELKEIIIKQDFIINKIKENYKNLNLIEVPFLTTKLEGIENIKYFIKNYPIFNFF